MKVLPIGLRPTPACGAAVAALLAVGLAGCGTATLERTEATDQPAQDVGESSSGFDGTGCVPDYTEGQDLYPVKLTPELAENFTIEYHDTHAIVTVAQPFQGATEPESFVVHRCGLDPATLKDLPANATVIQTPIDSLFSGSTTHLPLLADLEQLDVVKGVSKASYVSGAELRSRIDSGVVTEYAASGTIDAEKVIAAQPDVLMTGGQDAPEYDALRAAGVAVVPNAEWLEAHPVGRAEWIKVMGLLTGDEGKAQAAFDEVRQAYEKTAALVSNSEPVSILPGQMYEGTWYMPGGGSYVASLIEDAGGTYAFADDNGTGSKPLALEEVLNRSREADVWIASADVQTLGELAESDARYAEFAAFGAGNVWTNNKAMGPTGGNEYFERGVTRPDLVLADLAHILHPDVLPDHTTEFYRKLDAS